MSTAEINDYIKMSVFIGICVCFLAGVLFVAYVIFCPTAFVLSPVISR